MATSAPRSKPRRRALPSTLPQPAGDRPARPTHLRDANCRTLLDLLRSTSPCSKADLVRASGLSATTVSGSIRRLSDLGLVAELGEGASSGGRPPGLLRFRSEHTLVAAADVGGTRLRMALADLAGKRLAHWAVHLGPRQKTPRAVVGLMARGLDEMARPHGGKARVKHLAVGAPGITDTHQGLVVAAPNLEGWQHLPLRTLVERELDLQATIENDTNLAALGERAAGVAQGMEDFVFIALGTGIGAGIVLGGALHHGSSWSAGEIGYLPVLGKRRQRIRLEQTGQLERAIGGAGIESMWRTQLRGHRGRSRAELAALRAPQIFDLAAQGHALAKALLASVARVLADAITAVALLLDPQIVVLGGGVGSHPALGRATQSLLEGSEFARPPLRSSALGTEAQIFGGIALALATAEAGLLPACSG